MKMISKATALLLAFMLTFSMTGSALGEDTNLNVDDYNGFVNQGVAFYEGILACEDAYALLDYFQGMTEEEADGYFMNLSEDRFNEVYAHMDGIFTAMTLEELVQLQVYRGADINDLIDKQGVNYTKVAPLANGPVQVASKARRYALPRSTDATDNGVELSKKAETLGNGQYKITLEAYTTGKVSVSTASVPTDIVLVLDESASMLDKMNSYEATYNIVQNSIYYVKIDGSYVQVQYCEGGLLHTHSAGWYTGFHLGIHWGTRYEPMTSKDDTNADHVQFYKQSATTTSRRDALVAAAKEFVQSVYDDAVSNNVDHRVAVIGFSGKNNASTKVGLVNDIRQNKSNVDSALNGLNANGGTYIEDGMTAAENAFDNAAQTENTTRKRVVVVFTDGIPGSGSWNQDTINGSANPAIRTSYALKNTYGATVYSIGMLDDANPQLEISDEINDAARTNKFLHYLSSNFPDAQSMTNGGSGGNKGYYLAASDSASLKYIFEKISNEISTPTIDLGSDTIVKDIVSPYFQMPANASDITVKTAACTSYSNGTAIWGTAETLPKPGITFDATDNSVNVTGFNFTDNFVSEKKKDDGTYGRKLIIEFTVSPKAGFLGGNNVPTNGDNSGVYASSDAPTPIETFTSPEVNVPIAPITVTAPDKNVYLLGNLTADALKADATVMCGGVKINLDPNAENYGLKPWQNAYVTITPSFEPADSTVLTGLTEDTSYTVGCTITPKTVITGEGVAVEQTGSATGKINVFKPEVTYQDSMVKYLVTIDNLPVYHEGATIGNGANLVSIAWKHANTLAPADMGTAPTLTYSYEYTPNALVTGTQVTSTQDVNVNVTFAINNTPVTEYTTTVREACVCNGQNDINCTHTTKFSDLANNHNPEFVVHVYDVLTSLTISKEGMDAIDAGQSFLFRVTGDNLPAGGLLIAINGNSSETISGLLVGSEYTVVEEESWSWRYTDKAPGQKITLKVSADENKVTVNNTRDQAYWLDGDCYAENVFNAQGTGN